MKKLFNAIRKSDLNIVKELIEKKPELVNCTAKQPLKKTMDSHLCRLPLKQVILR